MEVIRHISEKGSKKSHVSECEALSSPYVESHAQPIKSSLWVALRRTKLCISSYREGPVAPGSERDLLGDLQEADVTCA